LETKKRKETWRKIDPKKLKAHLEEHPDAYLKEIARVFECSDAAVLKAMRRLNITRKKNHSIPRNEQTFEFWFERYLLKEVQPGSVIVLDNAAFHRKSVLPQLAAQENCSVLFLPPYSPDLNPIEKKWAWLKRKLRELLPSFNSFDDTVQNVFQVGNDYNNRAYCKTNHFAVRPVFLLLEISP